MTAKLYSSELIQPDELTDGFFKTDKTGLITHCNQTLAKMHGYVSPEELIGRHFSELVSPEARNEVNRIFQKAVKTNDFSEYREIPVIKKEGAVFYIELKAAPIFEGDEITGTRGLNRDITYRKNIEEALRKNIRQYNLIAENIRDIVWQLDKNLRFLMISPSVTKILGYSVQEVIGLEVTKFLDQDGLKQMKEYVQNRLQSDQDIATANEYRMRHKDGRWVFVEVLSSPVYADGRLTGFTGITRDISRRKEMEENLRASETKYRDLIENMNEVIYVIDQSKKISYISPSVFGLLQYRPSEVIGRPVEEFVHKLEIPQVEGNIQYSMDNNENVGGEYRVLNRSGDTKWIKTSTRPLYEGAELKGIQGTFVDITERKLAEEQLKHINETLEQQVAERTRLAERRAEQLQALASELILAEQRERERLAEILHDHLQQILVAVKFNCEILSQDIGPDKKNVLENASNLISQSIAISRSLTAELSPMVLKQGSFSAALEWLVEWMEENQGLKVDLNIEPGADPQKEDIQILLFKSIREMLLNAAKHAGAKSIRLEMGRDKANRLRVSIIDYGKGFDPANAGEKRDGFGLFSIRERLAFLGGSLEIESSPGKGAAVSLVIPPAVPSEEMSEQDDKTAASIGGESPLAESARDKIRVLLVDDHPVFRQGLSSMLGLQSDIEVVGEAPDGEKAVRLARELVPDVILMDISMPNMNGIEATRIIHDEFPQTRIIGLSMHEGKDHAAAMKSAGASAYRSKDADPSILLAEIRGVIV